MVEQVTVQNQVARSVYFAGSEYLGRKDDHFIFWVASKMAADHIQNNYSIGISKLLAKQNDMKLSEVQLTFIYPNSPEIKQLLKDRSPP